MATGKEATVSFLMGEDPGRALQAAVDVVRTCLHGENLPEGKAAVPTTTLIEEGQITVTFGNGDRTSLTLSEIRRFANQPNRLSELILTRAILQAHYGDFDQFRGTIQSGQRSVQELLKAHGEVVRTPRAANVVSRLLAGQDVALIGPSASGKSVSSLQAARALNLEGWSVAVLDLADPGQGILRVLCELSSANSNQGHPYLIILDNVQCDPRETSSIHAILREEKGLVSAITRLLVIGWPETESLIESKFPSMVRMSCHPEEVLGPIVSQMLRKETPASVREQILDLAMGDVLIVHLLIDSYNQTGTIAQYDGIAKLAFSTLPGSGGLSPQGLALLYTIACLAQFEIEPSMTYLHELSDAGLSELVAARTIRRSGDYVSLGHRSYASMIATHLAEEFKEGNSKCPTTAPDQIAREYLQQADDRQIMAMLDRLDLSHLAEDETKGHSSTAFLANAWLSRKVLLSYLEHLSGATLPPWGDNIASAVFAAQAFAAARHPAWKTTADYVRNRWHVTNDCELPVPVGEPTAERKDFDEIGKNMAAEDLALGDPPFGQFAKDIDLDRMHRTWVLGLLLCFEGTAPTPDLDRIRRLRSIAAHIKEMDGNFYPARVPWITARVLIGLALAGESLNNTTVKGACDWLRREYPEGPRRTVWESGTGGWNTDVETTSMCVNALVRAGVHRSDRSVRVGASFIASKRAEWSELGREIDCAFSLETLGLVGFEGTDIGQDIAPLLLWASSRKHWRSTGQLATDSHEQSSKVPFIATYLINIIFTAVKNQLPSILEGMQDRRLVMEVERLSAPSWQVFRHAMSECVEEIQSQISSQIAQREGASGEAVSRELKRWHDARDSFRILKTEVVGLTSNQSPPLRLAVEDLVKKIDEGGAKWLGNSWRPVGKRVGQQGLQALEHHGP
nr:hypothetical protein [Ferrimicrobium acidiphilum]